MRVLSKLNWLRRCARLAFAARSWSPISRQISTLKCFDTKSRMNVRYFKYWLFEIQRASQMKRDRTRESAKSANNITRHLDSLVAVLRRFSQTIMDHRHVFGDPIRPDSIVDSELNCFKRLVYPSSLVGLVCFCSIRLSSTCTNFASRWWWFVFLTQLFLSPLGLSNVIKLGSRSFLFRF